MLKQVKTYYSAASPLAKVAAWLLLAGVVYFVGSKLYKKFLVFENAPLPDSSSVGVNLTQTEAENVRRITLAMHQDMAGINWGGRDCNIYREFSGMPDNLFIAVYNDFGNLYYREGEGTLRAWIDDEIFPPMCSGTKNDILGRMNALNLQ